MTPRVRMPIITREIKIRLPVAWYSRLAEQAGMAGVGKSMLAQRLIAEGLIHDSYMADLGKPRRAAECMPIAPRGI